MQTRIREVFRSSIDVKELILQDDHLLRSIESATITIIEAFRMSGSVLFCGNGGSAADAQHLAAEFSGRFYYDRPPLNSEALHVNTSYLTAVGNDYSFDEVYARIVRAKGKKGDVLVALSTSGNSGNILNAIQAAGDVGMTVIGMTGQSGGKMKDKCGILINVPSTDTPRIQESHITIGHIICELVESALFPRH
ncbi:Phosphoheptose isomerase [bioreactor metagenome]|jgi:D-sedoheptulose 7-phosphate isomerase|uniref:D-sedoheptulose-7-phosphate isomerase n=1 Tax=bioreactor metagenome TaxID=1076179 RepID=A0A644TSP5_9ZZZZ|nr:D-sedoheptulose 7-phosphate isomerase [Lentimicrobium sp.]MEA5111282.1 D-sedoheptulose 7-phosphate isomerase [Lentimicrobium sp.]